MSETSRAPRVTAHADGILKRIDILNSAYLETLRNGAMTLEISAARRNSFSTR